MKYEINIEDDSMDLFQNEEDNVVQIRVYDQKGNEITKSSVVEMFLSKNALIGLGTELIRMAQGFKEGKHVHLEPVSKENPVQRLGVFLTPDSGKLIVCCNDSGPIDEYLK